MSKSRATRLFKIANELALGTPGFFETKGPGVGNDATNAYIAGLGRRAAAEFGKDFSEQRICGENSLAVDFYFPEDHTIVEIALGLRNPNTEFEKDLLKAVMAKSLGCSVKELHFISKPGGERKCRQPGRSAFRTWLEKTHGVIVHVRDLGDA